MVSIIKEIMKNLPEEKVSAAAFEGANIVLYTKDKDFFLNNKGLIKKAVDDVKKRIELRPDPEIAMEEKKAEKIMRSLIPEEAKVGNVLFDSHRSQVVIEAEKPGLAIGKQGSVLYDIRKETFWVPTIRRTPAIRSKLIENIRAVLYQYSDYRRKFLDKIGHRIYDGWIRGKKNNWVRLTYLGSGRQVGRSCILFQTPESRVLLDCGVDVASPTEPYPFLDSPDFNISDLDAVIISHAHLDHVGFLPYLFKYGYRGPVYMTEPTRDITALLTLDYVKIMKSENREPIYDVEDVKEMVKHTVTLAYEEVTDVTPDVRITLYNAGHVLGSSMIHMHIGNGLHNLLYSGDMKYGRTQMLEAAATQFPRLETLMIESTYGGRDNTGTSREETDEGMAGFIIDTAKHGGKILLPVLGSGRAQEIMVTIHSLIKSKRLKPLPVYIDGMVWDITAIHTAYPEFLNSTLRRQIFHEDENPFLWNMFRQVGSSKERREVIDSPGPCVIIATSGMLVGGPSVEYLRALGEDPKNAMALTCYQGEGSLGRRIQRGEKEIAFSSGSRQEVVNLRFKIQTIEGFSAHSNRNQLLDFIRRCSPRPKKVIVNHGDSARCLDLASAIHRLNRIETSAPRNLESIRIK